MQSNRSPELKELLASVEAALIRAGQNARRLAEQTGTKLIIKERETSANLPSGAGKCADSDQIVSNQSYR